MAGKQAKAASTNDELDELFSGIGNDAVPKKVPTSSKSKSAAASGAAEEKDILAELENQLGEDKPSRPMSPRVRETASKRTSTNTPPQGGGAGRSSEDGGKQPTIARRSAESTRASFTPSASSSELQDPEKRAAAEQAAAAAAGGGWWGGIFATASATASAAMKQADAVYKEIQKNEEAKKWADQVRGNVGALKGFGDEIRHRALPTFTNILHTLAPPISSHERLMIHITHDLVGYPSLDPLVHGVFSRVMAQVEGGDLLVIQRGQEFSMRSPSSEKPGFFAGGQSTAGWRDGPWWRHVESPRDLSAVKGLAEGTKLCRVSAEAYSSDYFNAHGGIESARQRAIEPVSESNPVRSSDIFLCVQAISIPSDLTLFASSATNEKEKEASAVVEERNAGDESVCFALYLMDPVHEIRYSAVSQALPAKWLRWLDALAPLTPASSDEGGPAPDLESIPDEIRDIVDSGGVDPREWVAEWVEESLSLAVGIVAQRYVARRMGVGEGGLGKGKRRADVTIEEGGGEAARAGLI